LLRAIARLGLKAVFLRSLWLWLWLTLLAAISEDEVRRQAPRAPGVVLLGC
jgi:hypothetical protein